MADSRKNSNQIPKDKKEKVNENEDTGNKIIHDGSDAAILVQPRDDGYFADLVATLLSDESDNTKRAKIYEFADVLTYAFQKAKLAGAVVVMPIIQILMPDDQEQLKKLRAVLDRLAHGDQAEKDHPHYAIMSHLFNVSGIKLEMLAEKVDPELTPKDISNINKFMTIYNIQAKEMQAFKHGLIFDYLKQHVITLNTILKNTNIGSELIQILAALDENDGLAQLDKLIDNHKPESRSRRFGLYNTDARRRSDLADDLVKAILTNDTNKVRVAVENIAEYRYQLEYKIFEKATTRLDNLTIQSIVQRLNNDLEIPGLPRINSNGDHANTYKDHDQSGSRKVSPSIYLESSSEVMNRRDNGRADTKVRLSNDIENAFCAMPKDQPRTISVLGHHKKFPFNHFSSYVARVSEKGECEILSLNSLPGYNDQSFLDAIAKGIRGAENDDNKKINTRSLVIHQKDFSLCGFVSAVVLGSVDPNKILMSQFDHLEKVMRGAIRNKKPVRKLLARMAWWADTNLSPEANLKDMSALSAQLLSYVCGLPTDGKKIELSADNPALIKEYRRLLHAFDIEINDKVFLQMFKKIDTKEIGNEDARKLVNTIDYLNQIKKLVNTLPSTSGTKKTYNEILKNNNMTDSEKIKAIEEVARKRSNTLLKQKSTLFRNIDNTREIHQCLSQINPDDEKCSRSVFFKKSEGLIQQTLERADILENNLRKAGLLGDYPKKNKI